MVHEAAHESSGGGRLLNYPATHVFRPPRGEGALIGGAVAALAILLGLALIVRGLTLPVSFHAFGSDLLGIVLLLLGSVAGYWAYAIYSLRYVVRDDLLEIVWGLTIQVIPVDQIDRILLGQKYGQPIMDGITWPGCHVGRGRVGRIGGVLFYSTHRTAADIVYIMTAVATYGLSLSDARGLARTIQAAQESVRGESDLPAAVHAVLPLQALVYDRAFLIMAGGALLAFLLAAGYIYSRYQALPVSLILPYPASNGPERIGQRSELVRLPLTAIIWLLLGCGLAAWLHPRLRAVSYTLLAGTLFAELLYAIGALAAAH